MFWKIGWIAALTALLVFPFTAPAQEAKVENVEVPVRIDVDFPGGTINQMLDLIEKTNGVTPNVVVSEEMARIQLPPIKLKSVTIQDAVQAISQLQKIDGYTIVAQTKGRIQTITAYPDQRRLSPVGPPMKRFSKVYNMKSMLTPEHGIDDIVTAVRTAWEMLSEEHTGDLKYHVETNLLIAVGTGDELETVEEVLLALDKEKKGKEQAASEARLKETVEKLETQMHTLMEEVARMKQQLKEISQKKGKP